MAPQVRSRRRRRRRRGKTLIAPLFAALLFSDI
jgi:hypothetical protein